MFITYSCSVQVIPVPPDTTTYDVTTTEQHTTTITINPDSTDISPTTTTSDGTNHSPTTVITAASPAESSPVPDPGIRITTDQQKDGISDGSSCNTRVNVGILVGVPVAAVVVVVSVIAVSVSLVYKMKRFYRNKYRASHGSKDDPDTNKRGDTSEEYDIAITEPKHQTRNHNTNIMEEQGSAEYEMVDTSKMNSQASDKPLYIDMEESGEYSGLSGSHRLDTETPIYTGIYGNMK